MKIANIKKQKTTDAGEDVWNRERSCTVGMQIGAATVEISVVVVQKIGNKAIV